MVIQNFSLFIFTVYIFIEVLIDFLSVQIIENEWKKKNSIDYIDNYHHHCSYIRVGNNGAS